SHGRRVAGHERPSCRCLGCETLLASGVWKPPRVIGCAEPMTSMTQPHTVRSPRGTTLSCKGWQQEAARRMLMNNLDPEVAEHPEDLVVYGGTGRAARNWPAFDAIVRTLRELEDDETMLVQSGKPVGVFRTHE